jgi:polysaccharide biosynthesis transport protein
MSGTTKGEAMASGLGEEGFREVFDLVRRRLWIVVFAMALTIGTAVGASLLLPRVYEASTTLTADKSSPVVLLANPGQESSLFQEHVAQGPDASTLAELVKSSAVRDAAVRRFARRLGPKQGKEVLSSLRVQRLSDTELVRASVRHRDPKVAAAAANAIAEGMIEVDANARRRLATMARQFIGKQLALAKGELRDSETALVSFKDKSHDVSLSAQTDLNLRRLADLEVQLTDVRIMRQSALSDSGPLAGQDRQPAAQGTPDPLISALRTQLATLEVELSGLRQQFTPAHPAVISDQAKVEEAQRRLSAEIARHQASLDNRERELITRINRIEQTLLQVPDREATLARLTRDKNVAERNYLLLSGKFQEARIAEGSIGSAVRVVSSAEAPEGPVWPRWPMTMILGVAVGLLAGGAGAYMTEQLDDTVKSAGDVERVLGAPVLGTIPRLSSKGLKAADTNRRPPPLVQLDGTSSAAEAFHTLRTHLLRALQGMGAKCLVVTSALPGEGKSTVASNLAIAMTQTERLVWLIEGNLRTPVLGRIFHESDSPGMSALLAGRTPMENAIRLTAFPRLCCVVSGPPVADPAALLETEHMTRFVEHARGQADIILLDSPAVLSVIDAEVAALRADGAMLVVQTGRTTRRALAEARLHFARAGVRVVGAVLNRGRAQHLRWGSLTVPQFLRRPATLEAQT